VSLRADLVERADGEELVRFTVEDTGIGIAHADREHLFKPFTQADADGIERRTGGTGLGLSICERLAALMGGRIEMESEPGVGTSMMLTLPMPIAEPQALRDAEPAAAREVVVAARAVPTSREARAEGTLVLLVDDHPINRMVLLKQINALGYAAETAENGLEALDKWSASEFGLVLTDCNMPEMNGYELARHIRECEARNGHRRTIIIACTANALGGEAENCLAAGMDDYLAKPVQLTQLAQKMKYWLPLPEPARLTDESKPGVAAPSDERAVPIDPSVLAEISAGDPELERDIIDRFRRYNSEDANMLLAAFRNEDLQQVTQASHRITGASKTIGAMSLAAVCERLERASRANDWRTVTANMDAFSEELDRINDYVGTL
jgi:CheY-like chemotaxis protein/HPt (histidine-containing phosphotransfer) domain-containing protein